jgi:hypothetical protein
MLRLWIPICVAVLPGLWPTRYPMINWISDSQLAKIPFVRAYRLLVSCTGVHLLCKAVVGK